MTSTDLCFLKDFHFGVDMAENGQIALEKARDKQYDLILMDLAMPVLDGYGATNGILAEKLLSEVGRIVAVTAHTSPDDKKACFEAGMAGFLSKPVAKNDVLSHVKQTLISKSTFA
jgi:CheY-like chemotaxis protein